MFSTRPRAKALVQAGPRGARGAKRAKGGPRG